MSEDFIAALDTAPSPPEGAPGKRAPGRAGRNLPAAIGVGVGLGALVAVPLFSPYRWVFVAVVAAAVALGVYEVVSALRRLGARPPMVPLVLGGVAMVALAYLEGPDALFLALVLTVLACLAWRLADPAEGFLRDVAASTFTATYVPFLAGFAALLAVPDDGPRRVTAFIAVVVCSDTGGYVAGVLLGKHPMAPTVSPKKSWEGFAGSLLACAVAGAVLFPTLFGASPLLGVVYGLAVVGAATLGDLGESMVKRDIGIKDMGTLLPGHGGIMDRLDSLLPTAPVAYVLLTAFLPYP
ncbi:MAG: Phosphatidate cytidylyltransferase [uncultured Frankineae bacterium]|uniref:Phosphatidate cytidylyltransferase n=1 Tax=uncultured Frankineae bacterium TaxID=437475 RepID=A0A6J4L0X2_9ACTN|nr:MAG: Phosphatidate cytidylyltransferase [uncultured Frankineae bacterium]